MTPSRRLMTVVFWSSLAPVLAAFLSLATWLYTREWRWLFVAGLCYATHRITTPLVIRWLERHWPKEPAKTAPA